jgi:uncharacterized SAM-binding protein YcdF (DUF218 family)
LLWFTRKQKAGKIVTTIGVILLVALSYRPLPDMMLRPLEYKYPSLLGTEGMHDIGWVVVLGGGHTSDSRHPVTSQIGDSSLARLAEGIRLHNALPKSKLLLSGGGVFDPVPNAKIMSDVAISIGVDKNNLILEQDSRDTKDEARLIKGIVGKDKFILVTSASHMPRSMALFKKQGMNPIPAPTEHWVKTPQGIGPGMFFPSAGNLRKAYLATREYLGLGWAKIRGQI